MKFEDKFNELLTSMVELCFEYVDNNEKEIDNIYVYGCLEEFTAFDFFFKINNTVVQKHEINEYVNSSFDTSDDMQLKVIDLGISDLEELAKLFEKNNREIPKHIKMIYNVKTGEFDSKIIWM